MFTITAVPDAGQVMREFARVTRPGGVVMIASHFEAKVRPLARDGRRPHTVREASGLEPVDADGRRPRAPGLTLEAHEKLPPAGLIDLLIFRRTA